MPRNKFIQGGQRPVHENCKTQMEETEDDINKRKYTPCLWTGRLNIVRILLRQSID